MRRLRPLTAALAVTLVLSATACAPRTPAFDRAKLTAELRQPLGDWVQYWRRYDPGFALDSLRWGQPDSMRFETASPLSDSSVTTQAAKWWVWSPDHTRAVDPDEDREWDPDNKEFGYDDVAASVLMDFSTHTRRVFDRTGMDARNDDARWLDRDRFVVMGWASSALDGSYRPVVRLIDLDRMTVVAGAGRAVAVKKTAPTP